MAMDTQSLTVRIALNAWDTYVTRTNKHFDQLTDEELQLPVAPGRNRGIYLLGHLVAVHDRMLTLLGFGERKYPHLDELFVTNPDDTSRPFPPASELRSHWIAINQLLSEYYHALPPADWFLPHTAMTAEDHEKEPWRNRLSVLINRTNHLSYHLGQLILVSK